MLPYLDQWLEQSCTSAPCSNATLTNALDQVLGNCSDDFDTYNITSQDVAQWFQVYPLAREIACLKTSEPFNGTLPNITSNTTWQNSGGVPTSSGLVGGGASSTASPSPSGSISSLSASGAGAQQSGGSEQPSASASGFGGQQSAGSEGGAQPQGSATPTEVAAIGNNFAAESGSAQGGQNGQVVGGSGSVQSVQPISTSGGAVPSQSGSQGGQGGQVVGSSGSVQSVQPISTSGGPVPSQTGAVGGAGGFGGGNQTTSGNSTVSGNSTNSTKDAYCLTSLGKELSAYMGANLTFPYLEILVLGGNQTAQEKLQNIPPEALCQECVFAAFDLIEQSSPFLANQVVNKTTNQTLVGWLNATCSNATEVWTPTKNGTLPEGVIPTTFNSTYGFNVTYWNETTGNWTTKPAANVSVPIGEGSQYLNQTLGGDNSTDSTGGDNSTDQYGGDESGSGVGGAGGEQTQGGEGQSQQGGESQTQGGESQTQGGESGASATPSDSGAGGASETVSSSAAFPSASADTSQSGGNAQPQQSGQPQGGQGGGAKRSTKRAERFAAHDLRANEQ